MDISVVVPLYNKKKTIVRSLESVLMQTFKAHEIIVVNDGSTDGSEEIVTSMNIFQLKLINQKNAGVSAARNRGFVSAQCKWVAFLDADDEWLPSFLETIVRMQDDYPEYDVYATSYYSGDYLGSKKNIVLNRMPFTGDSGILSNYFEVASCSPPPLCSSTVCIRRHSLLEIGGFPLNLCSGEDLITWARLVSRKPPVYCNKPLAVFWQDKAHTYDDRPSRIPESEDYVGKALLELRNDNTLKTEKIERYISMWHKMRSSIYLRLGMKKKSFKESLKGLYYYPVNKKLYIYLLLCVVPSDLTRKIFKQFVG